MASDLKVIIDKIKREKGLDLTSYREPTLRRKLMHRMACEGASSLEEYIQMIDKDYHLYWRLISDFFIGVTDFFRDKKAWETVKRKILPELISEKTKQLALTTECDISSPGPPSTSQDYFKPMLRIWSAGCSTGEETYSLAILLHEVLGDSISEFLVHIEGTDILEDKLEWARRGEYEAEKVEKVGKWLRSKYFEVARRESTVDESKGYVQALSSGLTHRVCSDIRRLTHFRKYDLVRDEGLSQFDIVICRNTLIYFQQPLQEKVISKFHRALNRNGILWLGVAETLPREMAELFRLIDRKRKIYRKA